MELKPQKQLFDARYEFEAYLEERQAAEHYVSVLRRRAPLRRTDGIEVTSLAQLAIIRDVFTWDDVQSRWIRKDGRRIVIEPEIYDVILSFQRSHDNTRDELYYHIGRKFDGVQSRDVRKAIELWKEHKLGSLDVLDDTLWGGPAAVYEPRSITPPSRSNDSEDATYPSPGTQFPSNTRARTYTAPRPEEAATGVFHPDHPDWLHIGTCKDDENEAIWLALVARTGSQAGQLHPFFYHTSGKVFLNEAAANIAWHEEFEYSNFPGTGGQQKRAQRIYLHSIIQNQKDGPVPPPRSTGRISVSGNRLSGLTSRARIPVTQTLIHVGPISQKTELEHARRSTMAASTPTSPATAGGIKRRRKTITIDLESSGEDEYQTLPQPTKRIAVPRAAFDNSGILNPISPNVGPPNILKTEAGDGRGPQSTNLGSLSSNVLAGTSLLVSAEHQPGRAPVNVPLDDCRTQEQFFQTLVLECNLKGRVVTELSAVSATYMWNHKQHLIRKGRPRDWNIFCEDIRKAWEREARTFAEDGCEIKMMVHFDA